MSADKRNPPTLRDLARALNLDISTVSRGLKNSPRVAAATRRRIQEKAAELGYQPDPALARLINRRWKNQDAAQQANLALITPRNAGEFRNMYRVGSETAQQLGYTLDGLTTSQYPNSTALERVLRARAVEGIVLTGFPRERDIPALHWERYAVALCGDMPSPGSFHKVRDNAYAQSMMAFDRAWAAGYRRIGFVHPPSAIENDWRRRAAYDNSVKKRGIDPKDYLPSCELETPPHPTTIQQFQRWLLQNQPDALICAFWPHIEFVDRLLREGSLCRPAVIALAHRPLDGVATVHMPHEEVMRRCVRLLSHDLLHGQRGESAFPSSTLIEPIWRPGPGV